MNETISKKTARRMMLHAQLLDGKTKIKKGKAGIAQAVGHLGYVQIDTISVVERAHHHVLWTRVPGYEPEQLHRAHAIDRSVFEYWGHAASYLPMADYRFYIPFMRSFFDPKGSWYRGWMEKYGRWLEPVRKRIVDEGPLTARDFVDADGKRKGPWWDSTNHPPILADPIGLSPPEKDSWWNWKPAKAALELLFWRGELMVRERRGFERVYDLTERVLPAATDTRVPSPQDLGRFLVRRALNALGIASEREIRDYIRIGARTVVAGALNEMLVAGEIVRLHVEKTPGTVFASPAALEQGSRLRSRPPVVRILSPFDNLAIFRRRLLERFGFDYAFECYVPRQKRNHGYFVLPILFGENIVGRLDPKAERVNKRLIIRRLAVEPPHAGADGLPSALADALASFARFNGCDQVVLHDVRPKKILAPLADALGPGRSS